MVCTKSISLITTVSIAGTIASAQQAVSIDDDFVATSILQDHPTIEAATRYTTMEPISYQQLSDMRAAGVDPSWISNRFDIPSFDPKFLHRATQSDHPTTIESWATLYTEGRGVRLNDSLSFSVGRTTALRDGNISGSQGTLGGGSTRDHISSLTQSEGEYDIYDLSLKWDAVKAGPVTVSILSGLKAIEANIGKPVTRNGDTTIELVNRFAALPMIGSGVRWEISKDFSFSGAALTLPIQSGDALIDLSASTDLRISSTVGFSAGYRMIQSSFRVGSVDTSIAQEGIFARLEIRF